MCLTAGSPVFAEELTDIFSSPSINRSTDTKLITTELPTALSENRIREIIREEIKNNPELIIQTLQEFEVKLQTEIAERQVNQDIENLEQYSKDLYNNKNTPVFGNKAGSIIVVEFFDYNCKFCKQVSPVFEEVIDTYNVRRIYKEFPILSMESVEVSSISQAIMNSNPDLYEEFHSALYAVEGIKNKDSALRVVKELGLNPEEIEEIAQSESNMQILQDNSILAQRLNLTGTPAFIIGSTILRGAPTIETFEELLAR